MKKSRKDRIRNFPISFLAIALGLAGFSLAMQKAEGILGFPFQIHDYLVYLTIAVFATISGIYLVKTIKFPKEAKSEFGHPVKMNFFPIFAKIFLILGIIFLDKDILVSEYLWIAGTVLQFLFSVTILSAWIRHTKFQFHHLNPSWFIPIVGSVIVPIAGVKLGFVEISWFFFSIGLVMWAVLFSIVFNRIIFHNPISEKLIPTFFILFAPPAIAFISYVKLTGGIDPFAKILYYISLFLLIIIFAQARMFSRIKFYLSWWAYSFPMAAMTIATLLMYQETGIVTFVWISWALLVILTAIIIYLVYKTIIEVMRKGICIAEED